MSKKKKKKFKDPTKRKIILQKVHEGFMLKLWKLHIYVVGHAMKQRKRSERERRRNKLRVIRLEKLHQGQGCELCGRYLTKETSELHHIKPVALYPQLRYVPDNLMLLCHECHVGLHNEALKKSYMLLASAK